MTMTRKGTVSEKECFVCIVHEAPKAPDYIQGIATGAKMSTGSGFQRQDLFLRYLSDALCAKHFHEVERELLEADSATNVSFAWIPGPNAPRGVP
jgi:hypothetical protein